MGRQKKRTAHRVVVAVAVATVLMGARRPEAGCGDDDRRRLEAVVDQNAGVTLTFAGTRTTTHAEGRELILTPGTWDDGEPIAGGMWYGDDHSRIVLFEDGIQDGGRVSSGTWIEYPWGTPTGFEDDANFVLPPQSIRPGQDGRLASAVRNVDVGYCSQHQAWTTQFGDGIGDVATGALLGRQLAAFSLPWFLDGVPGLPGPGTGFGLVSVNVVGASEGIRRAQWWTEFGADSAASPPDDRFCVRSGLDFTTSFDGVALGVPVFLGCVYPDAFIEFCGRFTTRVAPEGLPHRDPAFVVTERTVSLGNGVANGPRVCGLVFEPLDPTIEAAVEGTLVSTIEAQFGAALASATVVRERTVPSPRRCGAPIEQDPTECAGGDTQAEDDARCARAVLGDGAEPASIRARCERRRHDARCFQDGDCSGRGVVCEGVQRFCSNRFPQVPCQSDNQCARQGSTCSVVTPGWCEDEEPMCYWNLEVDRIEMMPSGIEVVLAHDEDDVSAAAIDGWLGNLENAAHICRDVDPLEPPPDFSLDAAVTGLLTRRLGTPETPCE